MFKPNQLLLFFSLLALPCLVFAEESITITTYYPSPYGSYNELTTASNTYLATSSGRVGIGTTPKTWDAWYNVMQIGAGGFLFGHDTAPASAGFGSNVYISSGYKRVGVGQATLIDTEGGTFTFMVAPSGAADSAISWTNAMTILNSNGNVGIGTTSPGGKLDVNGTIYQRGSVLHADYVFEPGYELESIEEHSQYMWQNKHLKAVPKAQKDESGQDMVEYGARSRGTLEELEKAHVYIQQLNERVKALEVELSKLEVK